MMVIVYIKTSRDDFKKLIRKLVDFGMSVVLNHG